MAIQSGSQARGRQLSLSTRDASRGVTGPASGPALKQAQASTSVRPSPISHPGSRSVLDWDVILCYPTRDMLFRNRRRRRWTQQRP